MKKIINNLNKEKVQRGLFLGLVVLVFGVFMLSIFLGNSSEDPNDPNKTPGQDIQQPPDNNNPGDQNNETPPKTPEKYKAPCDTMSTSIIRHFYSLDDDAATQEMSLIQMGTRYQISRGVTYKNENDESFDVMATLSGTVTDVQESALYGNIITIDHGNDVKSEYLGVSNIVVQKGDQVVQEDVIASSGTAEYDTASSNHVHFRVSVEGTFVDPENLIGLSFEPTED